MTCSASEKKIVLQNTTSPKPSWLLRSFNIWLGAFFLIYGLLAVVFYFWIVVPYLQQGDMSAPRLLADSITYQEICSNDLDWGEWYWLRNAGPCISLKLLGHSVGLVTFVNVLLMTIPSVFMARSYGVSASKVLLVLLINPMTFLSLFGPNKEVFGIASTMTLLIFLQRRSWASLVATLIFATFARLPMLAVVAVFLLVQPILEPRRFGVRPWLNFWTAFMSMLLALSVVVLILGDQLSVELLGNVDEAADNSQSTIISLAMEYYSAKGLYVLTYIVRLLLNIFGALPNVAFISIETHGVYYVVGVIGSSLLFFLTIVKSIYRHRTMLLHMNYSAQSICFFVVFSTLIFCISPVIQHRYFFPLYPVLILAVLSRRISAPISIETVRPRIM